MEELIQEIGIEEENKRLYVKPTNTSFSMIYREAMEVHWNEKKKYLYGATPRKWGYDEWFIQILEAAQMQGCKLVISDNTNWVNIPKDIKNKIKKVNYT